jgi:predicted short-subunit dehydrogenase-like oxidoreductase (DUF2520 family)
VDKINISFAGAGRVGSNICKELYKCGAKIDLIVSETESNGRMLADECKSDWSSVLSFPDTTNVIIVAVPDHKIITVLGNLRCKADTIVAHTAGSLGLEVFPGRIARKAVLWPLQTFTKGRKISYRKLPFFIEASDENSAAVLEKLAKSIGGEVYFVSTAQREMLHLAAVFACNFTNYMLTRGKRIVVDAGLPFEVLEPLIKETVSKALAIGPENSQTGPAIRNDRNTIEKQYDLLSFSPELQSVYNEITQSIIRYYAKD